MVSLFLLCLASDDNVNNIHDYLTSFCIYTGSRNNIIMALVDPNIDQCEGDVSSRNMGIEISMLF